MTTPRRSGPSPALVLGIATAVVVVVFLAVLAARGSIVDQLGHVWAAFFPPPATSVQGAEIRNLYDIVFLFAAAIFILVEALIVFAVIRYRRRPTDTELPPQIHGNNLLEIVWTVIPTAIVLFLFVISWQTLNNVDPANAASPIHIRVTGARFQWTFDYLTPDGKQTQFTQLAPEMVVPVNERVHLTLRSPDVIHAFYVPQFLFKRDVVPGKENEFDFTADQTGTFRGQCAELCGEGHWVMQFTVKAVSADEYKTWLDQQIAQAKQQSQAPASAAPGGSGAPASGAPGASAPAGSGGTGGQTGATVQLAAKNVAFEQTTLEAPANTAFTLAFTNDDAGIPHNVQILDASNNSAFKGQIFNGVATQNYAVPALPAGTYKFVCDVHPNMTGELTVK